MDNFSYDFQPGERIGIIGKMERENQPFKFIDWLTSTWWRKSGNGETIKLGYYTQSGINPKPGQRVIDVIKEYGEFIPLMKGKWFRRRNY
jgi:ATP-binding cassette subfamily F protein uup